MNYYDDIASGYDALHGEEQRKKLGLIQSTLKELGFTFTSVLDVGCGTGVSMEQWSCEVKGIDPSEKLVSIAKEKGLHASVASAEDIPFEDDSFDLVISLTAAHHFDLEKSLREIKRVGRKYFVFSFLKKADVEAFRKALVKHFTIIKEVDEEKDVIFVCRS